MSATRSWGPVAHAAFTCVASSASTSGPRKKSAGNRTCERNWSTAGGKDRSLVLIPCNYVSRKEAGVARQKIRQTLRSVTRFCAPRPCPRCRNLQEKKQPNSKSRANEKKEGAAAPALYNAGAHGPNSTFVTSRVLAPAALGEEGFWPAPSVGLGSSRRWRARS